MDCAAGSAGSDDVAIEIHGDTPTGFPIDASREDFKDLVKRKRGESFHRLGGGAGIAAALSSSPESGIGGNDGDILRRQEAFGRNEYPKSKPNSLFKLMGHAFWDAGVIVLLIRAIVSLGYGIMNHGIHDGWSGAVPVLIAALLVAVVSAASTYSQAKRSDNLLASKSSVQVIRGGRRQEISICDHVVGDVVPLKIGNVVPADGVLLHGHALHVDESNVTGDRRPVQIDTNNTPFLTSGAKVVDGCGKMLVTAVGMATALGEMMSSTTCGKTDPTPIQERLQDVKSIIGRIGSPLMDRQHVTIIALLSAIVGILLQAVAIPQGLLLGLTLMLSFTMKRMAEDHVLVRRVSACQTMASVTNICTDKTGTLTLNQLTVTECWLPSADRRPEAVAAVLDLLQQGAGLNTSGSVYKPDNVSPPEISGAPTEKALLTWAVEDLGMDIQALKRSCSVLRFEPFNCINKREGALIRCNATGAVNVHWKGRAEAVLANCSAYVDTDGASRELDDDKRKQAEEIISEMNAASLRCVAFAYKPVDSDRVDLSKIDDERLTLLAIVGLKDPCRPGVRTAIEVSTKAGIRVTMFTGDNLLMARAIAMECGIISHSDDDAIVIEGEEFRAMSPEEQLKIVDRIRVMTRSQPMDKLVLVQRLKQMGHVVTVTGDSNADAPTLQEADIGLAMGITGTEVAKEKRDIIILDDNFSTVVSAVRWGRCIFNNIQKLIQFQLTVNVAALIINIVVAITSGKMPLTAERLLWVNLAMDTFGALALATDPPTDALMLVRRQPVSLKEPLISNSMWRNLLAQVAYQVAAVLGLHYRGRDIFGTSEVENGTMIFAAFFLCQVFNLFNAREIERKNVFAGVHRNWMFLAIVAALLGVQVVMVGVLTWLSGTEMLRSGQWGACVAMAAMSWPIGWATKFIPVPDRPLHEILSRWKCFYMSLQSGMATG